MADTIDRWLASHEVPGASLLLSEGQVIGDYRVLSCIGRGGNGQIYRVEHTKLKTLAALKLLINKTPHAKERFQQEAQIYALNSSHALPHLNVVGEFDGHAYMVMELLRPAPLPTNDHSAATYLIAVCRAVATLHALGYVHRDIKPTNIMMRDDGTIVLIDMGLVKPFTAGKPQLPQSLSIVAEHPIGVGTPGYAAPEQLLGGDISPQTDIHALGVLINTCFDGKIPRAWRPIVLRATSSISEQRFDSLEALVTAIERRHRAPGVMWLVLALVLLLAALGARLLLQPSAPSAPAAPASPPVVVPAASALPETFEDPLLPPPEPIPEPPSKDALALDKMYEAMTEEERLKLPVDGVRVPVTRDWLIANAKPGPDLSKYFKPLPPRENHKRGDDAERDHEEDLWNELTRNSTITNVVETGRYLRTTMLSLRLRDETRQLLEVDPNAVGHDFHERWYDRYYLEDRGAPEMRTVRARTIRLRENRPRVFIDTIQLNPSYEYFFIGPGTFDAPLVAFSSPVIVHVVNATLINRTKLPFTQAGIIYHLERRATLDLSASGKDPAVAENMWYDQLIRTQMNQTRLALYNCKLDMGDGECLKPGIYNAGVNIASGEVIWWHEPQTKSDPWANFPQSNLSY